MALALTEKANKHVKKLLEEQNLHGVFLRMGVKGGGCSGLSYSLEFDSELGPHDKKFEVDGVQIVCDAKSYLYLSGTEVWSHGSDYASRYSWCVSQYLASKTG